jgi:hypothetical protein
VAVHRFGFAVVGGSVIAYGATSNMGVYRSTDGSQWYTAGSTGPMATAALAVQRDDSVVYAGNANGVYALSNSTWSLVNNGLLADPVAAIAIDPKMTTTVFAGLKNLGEVRSTDGGNSLAPPAAAGAIPVQSGIDVTGIAIDESDDKLLWAVAGSAYRSTDGGSSWAKAAGTSGGNAVAAAPSMAGTFWTVGYGGALVINAADTMWMAASSGLPPTGNGVALVVHPTMPLVVYDVVAGSGLFRTTDGGASWATANTGLGTMNVTSLAIDRTTPTTLYAGTADMGLWKTTDGTTWAASSTGLTSMAVTSVAVSASQPSIVYVGTAGKGVFRSTDGGATWAADNAGLGSLSITRLAIDPSNPQRVFAGTVDGGIYKTAP